MNTTAVDPGKLFILAGPCVLESRDLCLETGAFLARCAQKYNIQIVFKGSWDKANRTSLKGFRGPGMDEGLKILEAVKKESALPLVTDIHLPDQAKPVGEVVDIVQIPAFLCRQTDLLLAAAKTGKTVNVKKGQFLAPADMKHVIGKIGANCMITERGTTFGYNRLIVDFTGASVMRETGVPLVFDATHSVQLPGSGEGCSLGNRDRAAPLARAAVSCGYHGLFFEIHPDPDHALCDGPNSLSTSRFEQELDRLIALYELTSPWYQATPVK